MTTAPTRIRSPLPAASWRRKPAGAPTRLEDAGEFCSSPGMVSESFTLVRATGLVQVGPGGGTDGEDITVRRVPLAELSGFVEERRKAGLAIDVRIMGLLLAGERSW